MGNIFGTLILRPFGLIILQIYKLVGSYGLAIILFALLIKLVLIPLAIKGKKNMIQMNALQPELTNLQKKYANNREKLGIETQKLYEKHHISPTSGCLTQFIQLPILMGLYSTVRQPLKYILGFGDTIITQLGELVGINVAEAGVYSQITITQMLGQKFVENGGSFPQSVIDIVGNVGELIYIDFNFFGIDLSVIPSLKEPSLLWVIPILSGLTAFLSMWVMQKTQRTNNQNQQNDATQKSMRMMNWISPLMSLYFGFILPGTIGIYWIFNNIFTCVQEFILGRYLNKKMAAEIEEISASTTVTKKKKKGGEKA